jgi:hypothetical protein
VKLLLVDATSTPNAVETANAALAAAGIPKPTYRARLEAFASSNG